MNPVKFQCIEVSVFRSGMEHSSWARNREEKLIAVSPRVYICMAKYRGDFPMGISTVLRSATSQRYCKGN